jgi:hypothetical protein
VDAGSLESASATGETDEDGVIEEERETVQLRCTSPVRAKWWRARQLARRVAGEALPVWGCKEAIAAEVLSALPVELEEPSQRAAPRELASSGVQVDAAEGERAANGCAELGLRQERGAPPLLRYDGCDRLSPAPRPRFSRGRLPS